jgi:hypothetical protein
VVERVMQKAERLCRAIDDLLLAGPCKTLVVEPEARELLWLAHLRREAGRTMAAVGASRREESWKRLEATLRAR